MENIELSESNKKTLQNKISKAINAIPDEDIQQIFLDYIEREVDNLYSEDTFKDMVEAPIQEVLRNMFVEKGLIKEKVGN
jgi:hypothetical protein